MHTFQLRPLAMLALSSLLAPRLLPSAPPPGARATYATSHQQADLGRLGWMAGCWRQRRQATVMEEHWMSSSGGAMIGMSRTVVADRLRAWESLRLVVEADRVVYIAQPNGGAPVRFAATTMSDSMAVFENAQHDFPQRITYRRLREDSLTAQIAGIANGTTRSMDMPMQRVACHA